MAQQEQRVAVWLTDVCDNEKQLAVLHAIYRLMGDFDAAYQIVDYGKGVVAGPISLDAAEIVVKWVESVGGTAGIDDGYYEE